MRAHWYQAGYRRWARLTPGGIGLELSHSLNTLAWPQVTLIFVVILATVVVSEWVSARVRHAII